MYVMHAVHDYFLGAIVLPFTVVLQFRHVYCCVYIWYFVQHHTRA